MIDWLARNVHDWGQALAALRGGKGTPKFFSASKDGDVIKFTDADVTEVTRQQWLDRRAELQNKPSWEELPAEARYLCQERNGEWGAWGDKPTHEEGLWSADRPLSDFNNINASKYRGEVLGDWRDTLETRPVDRLAEEFVAKLQSGFEPFTSVEDAQPELVEMTSEMLTGLKAGRRLERPAPATHTIHHAAFLHQGCQLLLNEPELVVFRTADGELLHCKPKECLIDPDTYGLAARLLSDMSGYAVAPEHIRELCEQMDWRVE